MQLHFDQLDQHFSLPKTHSVSVGRPLQWLVRGWLDMMKHPGPSLAYGLVVTLVGWSLLALAIEHPYLLTTFVTGFLLLAPLVAAGLYELTSEREEGRPTSFTQSLTDLAKNFGQIAFFGIILGMVAIAWERVSAILFALFYSGGEITMGGFVAAMLGEYQLLLLLWLGAGFILACIVFALTAVSIPMLADKEVDAITAMMTSLRVVGDNLPAMMLWAALIVALIAIGFLTYLIGLIVIFPLLGHATWMAYKDLVE